MLDKTKIHNPSSPMGIVSDFLWRWGGMVPIVLVVHNILIVQVSTLTIKY